MGFISVDNSSLVTPSQCPLFISDPLLFETLSNELQNLSNTGIQSASLRLFKTHSHKLILAFSMFPKTPKKLLTFSCAQGVCYKSPRKEVHLGDTMLTHNILGEHIVFSPYGFMQNNLPLSEQLYQRILDIIGKTPQTIFDLYCGAGIMHTLLIKQGHQVVGIEKNRTLKNKPPHIVYGKVEDILPTMQATPNITILNPPKEGINPRIINHLNSPTLIYISCMPSTLARDLNRLSKKYYVSHVEAFDLFPQTTHIETLIIMKKNIQKTI